MKFRPILIRVRSAFISGTLPLTLVAVLPTAAQAANFSRMYVFGDSLSDTGNSLAITTAANAINPLIPVIPPGAVGYFNGRFSNGSIWLDELADRLELSLPPISTIAGGSSPTGVNLAINSATTGEQNTFPLPLPGFVGVQQQLAQFATANATADPNALYVLWAGANDYLGAQVTNPAEPVANLSNAVQDLYSLGARNFLVANLPALGVTPLAQSRGSTVPRAWLTRLCLIRHPILLPSVAIQTNIFSGTIFIPPVQPIGQLEI